MTRLDALVLCALAALLAAAFIAGWLTGREQGRDEGFAEGAAAEADAWWRERTPTRSHLRLLRRPYDWDRHQPGGAA